MIPFPNKKYNIIYSDPAWHYQTWGEGGNRNVTSKYKTMSMQEIWDLPVNEIADDNCELIQVTTLDKLLVLEKNISLIKIDVEGYEKQVLLGCKETLKNPNLNVIIIELNDSNKQYDYTENETISILKENGFSPYKYIYPDNILVPLEKKNFDSYNTIFIRNINFVKDRIKQKSVVINKNTIELK